MAQAILNSQIPVVSAVGHEIDFTISDFVADQRAATPSAAAEIVSPDSVQLANTLRYLTDRLLKRTQEKWAYCAQKNDWLQQRLMRAHPDARLMQQKAALATAFKALEAALHKRLTQLTQRWQLLTQKLDTLSPLATLGRGYTITRDANTKHVLHSITQLSAHQTIEVQFMDGSVLAKTLEA